ncbi:MAG: hypothetical protein JHC54_12820 [Acinetobacter sp.]|nr:hypothetical protein [Acinetobacter sp.]
MLNINSDTPILTIKDCGDESVGIFASSYDVQAPIDGRDSEEIEAFRNAMIAVYSEFAFGKVTAIYDFEVESLEQQAVAAESIIWVNPVAAQMQAYTEEADQLFDNFLKTGRNTEQEVARLKELAEYFTAAGFDGHAAFYNPSPAQITGVD